MPVYEFGCVDGHTFDKRVPVEDRNRSQPCACGQPASRRYTPDFGFKIGRDGLLNTRDLPNDGVHSVGKSRKPKKFGYGTKIPKTGGKE